ncbi:MAG: hypothetical protein A2Z30_02865 [Chloroflexi bacterium RBG_16_64_43]|nr:MAG: hypothetical protein A2Z30_02865 [Chloroflexi bacterium RBG_16_64_43]
MSQDIWVVVETLRGAVMDITYTSLAAGRILADGLGIRLVAVLLGHNAEPLAGTLGTADSVIYVDHASLADFTPEAYRRTISGLAKELAPRAILFGHTSMGMDIACGVSLDLNAPLISSCERVKLEDGRPWYSSPTCGGKIIAEGPIPDPVCVLTIVPGGYKPEAVRLPGPKEVVRMAPSAALEGLRITLKKYIEPQAADVDIAKEPMLVAVGRGIQQADNIALAEALAQALGGVVCGSRPVVDQGWLPVPRLVGKSGVSVKPKCYVALGVSGAPEHVEGISGAELIIAINTDPRAPIFNVAHFGTLLSMFDLLPALTEKIRQAPRP